MPICNNPRVVSPLDGYFHDATESDGSRSNKTQHICERALVRELQMTDDRDQSVIIHEKRLHPHFSGNTILLHVVAKHHALKRERSSMSTIST